MVRVYLYDLNNLADEEEYSLRRGLASEKRKPVLSVCGDLAAESRDIVNLGVSAVLDEAFKPYGIREKNALFTYGKYGKPKLKDHEDIHFNLSHSGRYVICAAGEVPVGIDIQKNTGNKEAVAKRFFSEREYASIAECRDKKEAERLFYRYWTLKESFIKAIGTGIGDCFNRIEFVADKGNPDAYNESLRAVQDIDGRSFNFREYVIDEYNAAVCIAGETDIDDIKLVGKTDVKIRLIGGR